MWLGLGLILGEEIAICLKKVVGRESEQSHSVLEDWY